MKFIGLLVIGIFLSTAFGFRIHRPFVVVTGRCDFGLKVIGEDREVMGQIKGQDVVNSPELFISAWRDAIKGDQSKLLSLIPATSTATSIKWDNPFASNAAELSEGLKQYSSYFGEPSLTVFGTKTLPVSDASALTTFEVDYHISFWYPMPWRPRVIIPGKAIVKMSLDGRSIVSVEEKWELSVKDILSKGILPRWWDLWHVFSTPIPEYPPIKLIANVGEVAFREMPPTVALEARWSGLAKYNGPPLLAVAGFSLFGKLRTSRPRRDPIVTIQPVEVTSYTFTCPETRELMKQSRWTFHVPTSMHEQVWEKAKSGTFFTVEEDDDNEKEGVDDLVDEVDYEIGVNSIGLMNSVTGGVQRGGNIVYDEEKKKEFESFEKKEFRYRIMPRRVIASVDLKGEVTSDKISSALMLLQETVRSDKGKEILGGKEVKIRRRDLDSEGNNISNKSNTNTNTNNMEDPMLGLQLWNCKGCFNPSGEPAMAIYELQYGWRMTRVFIELEME